MSEIILTAKNIKKQYGLRTILDFETFAIYEGERVGVVGLNGAGKTTLLHILSGEIPPDEGQVYRLRQSAYIRQFEEREEGETLSGGENVKKRIQRELSLEDSIVFADEPTANLDKDGVKWLESRMKAARTMMIISHDRQLMDKLCTRMIEVREGKLHFYTGNYTDYVRQKQEEEARIAQQKAELQHIKTQLAKAIEAKERHVSRQKKQKKKDQLKNSSEARLGGYKRAASHQKLEKEAQVMKHRVGRLNEQLEKLDTIRKAPKFRMNFSRTNPPEGKIVVQCQNLSFAYGDKIIFNRAEFAVPNGQKIAITGKNGAGKTTLLRLLYQKDAQFTVAPKLKWGYLWQGLENLMDEKTVLENVLAVSVQERAEAYSILAGLLFTGTDFDKKAGVLSGGERIRLSLAMLIASDCNALLLDEPTNYLDIPSVEAVQATIKAYPGTVLIVSHDAYFLQAVADQEWQVESGKIAAGRITAGKAINPPAIEVERKAITAKASAPEATDPAKRMVLEMRRVQLTAAISAAPAEQKEALEEEYAQVLRDLAR